MAENYFSERQNGDQAEYVPASDSIEVMLEQAQACLEVNCFGDAAVIYEEILKVETDNIQAEFNLGLIRQIDGELPEAISCFSRVLEQEPGNFQVLCRLADAYREQGWWDEAVTIYRQALRQEPDQAEIHYRLGLVYYHKGEKSAAAESYRRALELDQSHAEAYYNLGVIHYEHGDYDSAVECYEQALNVRPDDVDTHYNLALTLTSQGDLKGAAEHYLNALELAPEDPELHNSLGLIYKQLNELGVAEACYRRALSIKPDYGCAYTNLAVVLHIGDKIEQAIECYNKAIEFGHQPEAARYMLAALTGADRDSAPRDYVRALFDSYADNFDHSLTGELGYNSPTLLREMAGELLGPGGHFSKMVDLGCGTGLIGSCFRDIADHMIGVDLSTKMLDKAVDKNVYDELHCADILEFLGDGGDTDFDLVVAADVLIYIGALETFFGAVKRSLNPGGHLLLTVEKHEGEGGRCLRPSGRYAYSNDYIVRLAKAEGLLVMACREVDLRKEKGEWLKGNLFVLQVNREN